MKVKSAGSTTCKRGFSTLEMIIALALMALIITTSLQTVYMSQYWILGGSISGEALLQAKVELETLRSIALSNFYAASSSRARAIESVTGSSTVSCTASFCFESKQIVSDVSVCTKTLSADVSWRISPRYSTSSVVLETVLVHGNEVLAQGGDCLLSLPRGNWQGPSIILAGSVVRPQQFSSGIDALGGYMYLTASSAPQLSIYQEPPLGGGSPVLVGTSSGTGRRLNSIDVIRDSGTGRRYAYVMQHASTSQLGVFDVTEATSPILLNTRTLLGVDSSGSFPQGWRVVAYGNRLYALTRETAGAELHIFDISKPEQPTEFSGGIFNLNRTVNEFVVREQLINDVKRRFIIMAGSADLKELGIFEVTGDVPVERVAINLGGTEDALSVSIAGNTIYLGRRATSGGPELYQFDVLELLNGSTVPQAMSEVGADVSTIRLSGPVLYLGTNRSGAEFQVWHSSNELWSSTTANTARISSQPVSKLAPLGVELSSGFLFAHSQSATQPEHLIVITTP